jgi:hypothetical protein
MNAIVKQALNQTLYEQPVDPVSNIAGLLITNSKKSYPVFSRFEARSIYLLDSTQYQTL